MVRRICPTCRGTAAELLLRDMVRCVTCGDERHHTHWKTPSEHDARERLVARMCANIDAGRDPFANIKEPA